MPLYDLYDDGAQFDTFVGFRMADQKTDGRVVVHVTVDAITDTPPTGEYSLAKFEANRGTYAAIASEKYDKLQLHSASPPIVRVTTSDL